MKKYIAILSVIAFASVPFMTQASTYVGAYYAKVIQAPISGCNYMVIYDNNYGYDLLDDYVGTADIISNGDYFYGGIQYGMQFFYDSTQNKPLSLYVEGTMMGWNSVVNSYYSHCPRYNY